SVRKRRRMTDDLQFRWGVRIANRSQDGVVILHGAPTVASLVAVPRQMHLAKSTQRQFGLLRTSVEARGKRVAKHRNGPRLAHRDAPHPFELVGRHPRSGLSQQEPMQFSGLIEQPDIGQWRMGYLVDADS